MKTDDRMSAERRMSLVLRQETAVSILGVVHDKPSLFIRPHPDEPSATVRINELVVVRMVIRFPFDDSSNICFYLLIPELNFTNYSHVRIVGADPTIQRVCSPNPTHTDIESTKFIHDHRIEIDEISPSVESPVTSLASISVPPSIPSLPAAFSLDPGL
uniref:Uncharacterized protein n=1 Tax=Vespula pensylvanica TaxID=30213 RepID=A0A834KPW9_VESPE|nr:hypothetical protein H0235_013254 [Vespula pensylvanica]